MSWPRRRHATDAKQAPGPLGLVDERLPVQRNLRDKMKALIGEPLRAQPAAASPQARNSFGHSGAGPPCGRDTSRNRSPRSFGRSAGSVFACLALMAGRFSGRGGSRLRPPSVSDLHPTQIVKEWLQVCADDPVAFATGGQRRRTVAHIFRGPMRRRCLRQKMSQSGHEPSRRLTHARFPGCFGPSGLGQSDWPRAPRLESAIFGSPWRLGKPDWRLRP